jgi:hypothetical protein
MRNIVRRIGLFALLTIVVALTISMGTGFGGLNNKWVGIWSENAPVQPQEMQEIVNIPIQPAGFQPVQTIDRNYTLGEQSAAEVKVELSHSPEVNESVELSLSAWNFLDDRTPHTRAWVEFWYSDTTGSNQQAQQQIFIPIEQVITSGVPNWEGTLSAIPMNFSAVAVFPRAGLWVVRGYIFAPGWPTPLVSKPVEVTIPAEE